MNRRHFIYALGTAAAAVSTLSPRASVSPEPDDKSNYRCKLGLVTYNLGKDMDVPTLIRNCSETGFEGVELRTTHAHKVEVNLSPSQRAEVKQRFADSSVKLVSLGSTFDYHTTDSEKLRRDITATQEYIRLAHDVGAEAVKVRPNDLPANVPAEKTLEQIGKSFREIAICGAEYGIDLRLEVHGNKTSLLPNIKTILDIADHPNANICWNSNMSDLDGEGFDFNYELVKNKIHVCHITELWNDAYPWRKLFANLKRDHFNGFTLAEIPANNDPTRILRYYRALWLALQYGAPHTNAH